MNKYSYVHIKDVRDIDKFNDEKCEVTLIHEDNVKKAINELPDDELIVDLSDMFKIFGDQTRVKILMALESGELCVCDIAAVMDMSQSAISHQLRVLKQSNIVKTRRQGKVVYYSISDDPCERNLRHCDSTRARITTII